MAIMRSQLALALLLAVACAVSAQELTMKDWHKFLKDKQQYENWCNRPERCNPVNGKVTVNAECTSFTPLRVLMENHLVEQNVAHDDADAKNVIINATFCVPENMNDTTTQGRTTTASATSTSTSAAPSSTSTAAAPSSTSTAAAPSGTSTAAAPSGTSTAAAPSGTSIAAAPLGNSMAGSSTTDTGTSSMPTSTTATGSSTSPSAPVAPLDASEGSNSTDIATPDETNHLYWILPLIGLVLVLMVVGGIYIHRYAKKSGYHHSSKSNGETAKAAGESA